MKRAAVTVIFFGALVALGGCPSTESRDGGCYRDSDCDPGYQCDDYSGACLALPDAGNDSCSAPTDCSASYTCGKNGHCVPGDCYFNGCVIGFQCGSSTGTWECAPSEAGAAGASSNEETTEAGASGVGGAAGEAG